MSTHWDLFCETCSVGAGAHINHAEEDLARVLAHRDALAACGAVEGLTVEVRGDRHEFPSFFAAHVGHEIVVRSEYGYNFGDCAEYGYCGGCGHPFACRLPRGHEGDHSPKKANHG